MTGRASQIQSTGAANQLDFLSSKAENLLFRPTGKTLFLPRIPDLEEALSVWKDGKPGYCAALHDWIRAPLIYSVQSILYDVVFDKFYQK